MVMIVIMIVMIVIMMISKVRSMTMSMMIIQKFHVDDNDIDSMMRMIYRMNGDEDSMYDNEDKDYESTCGE